MLKKIKVKNDLNSKKKNEVLHEKSCFKCSYKQLIERQFKSDVCGLHFHSTSRLNYEKCIH